MRVVFWVLGRLIPLVVLAVIGLGVMVVVDRQPLVPEDMELTAAQRQWAHQWLKDNSPRGLKDGDRTTLRVTEAEAQVLANYLIDRLGAGRAAVRIDAGRAWIAVSVGLPWDPDRSFANADVTLSATDGLPQVEAASFAGIPLPFGLTQGFADRVIGALEEARLLRHVAFAQDLAMLTYEWHKDALEAIGTGMMNPEDRRRLMRYQAVLSEYAAMRSTSSAIPLTDLLDRVFFEALIHGRDGDPRSENRAAILAVAAYVNGRTLRAPSTLDISVADPAFLTVTLKGRRDLAQHFCASAAIAAQGGRALSELVGLLKEVKDSSGGSGFSFADMAANRSGIRFAKLATQNEGGALRVQGFAQRSFEESDIMPSIAGLPEGMSEAQFEAAFGNPNSFAYKQLVAHIDERISDLRLFRP